MLQSFSRNARNIAKNIFFTNRYITQGAMSSMTPNTGWGGVRCGEPTDNFKDSSLPTYPINNTYTGELKAVILDWSGTTCDKYVIAPAVVFYDVFEKFGVPITMEEARQPMGLRKDLHIEQITKIPEVRERWHDVYGRYPNEQDVSDMFEDFVPMQLACLNKYSGLLPETLHTVEILKNRYNLKIGATTGFTRAMVDILLEDANNQGFYPDVTVAGDEVNTGARPTPHMVYKNCDLLNVHPIQAVVKVDDTVGGVGEAINAGCWGVGIARYSNYMNINSYEEEETLSENDITERLEYSRSKLRDAGAHYIIDTLDELPHVVEDINRRLKKGESPSSTNVGISYENYNIDKGPFLL